MSRRKLQSDDMVKLWPVQATSHEPQAIMERESAWGVRDVIFGALHAFDRGKSQAPDRTTAIMEALFTAGYVWRKVDEPK